MGCPRLSRFLAALAFCVGVVPSIGLADVYRTPTADYIRYGGTVVKETNTGGNEVDGDRWKLTTEGDDDGVVQRFVGLPDGEYRFAVRAKRYGTTDAITFQLFVGGVQRLIRSVVVGADYDDTANVFFLVNGESVGYTYSAGADYIVSGGSQVEIRVTGRPHYFDDLIIYQQGDESLTPIDTEPPVEDCDLDIQPEADSAFLAEYTFVRLACCGGGAYDIYEHNTNGTLKRVRNREKDQDCVSPDCGLPDAPWLPDGLNPSNYDVVSSVCCNGQWYDIYGDPSDESAQRYLVPVPDRDGECECTGPKDICDCLDKVVDAIDRANVSIQGVRDAVVDQGTTANEHLEAILNTLSWFKNDAQEAELPEHEITPGQPTAEPRLIELPWEGMPSHPKFDNLTMRQLPNEIEAEPLTIVFPDTETELWSPDQIEWSSDNGFEWFEKYEEWLPMVRNGVLIVVTIFVVMWVWRDVQGR
ncbi:hypothetical protein AB1L30_15980 [Bremerella sp. JC817]|uniref:hypothetical protein n=1 Tax=Bremerella sp. JC817 TaxID=3231756 RepID=UPI00345A485F